ncbi:MAG: hypothetical protein WCF22_11735 [Candidatus Sulfotelmatobacter sp.]
MSSTKICVDNQEIIRRFENGTIPAEVFHHVDHVRLAFAYLCEYALFEALQKFCAALKRFAACQGKPQLYNETITCAYFFLIHERMARGDSANWDNFACSNPDLLIWKDGILNRYYEEATLKSDLARRVFLLPDKVSQSQRSG